MNPDLALMPFQEEGSTLLAGMRRAMLAWDAGIGKTPTAVRACVKAKARRILVFCPPIATSVWRQHFIDWSEYEVRVFGGPGMFTTGTGARIVPYSQALKASAAVSEAHWDVVIIDEAHYLKSSGAQRTQAVYGPKVDGVGSPCENVSHVWLLTGTPLLNNPGEFWTHLRALVPNRIQIPNHGPMSEDFFLHRFCVVRDTPYGVRILGNRNAEELRKRIQGFAFRKRIKDVILDLPELRIVDHPLPEDTPISDELRAAMRKALELIDASSDEHILAALNSESVAFSTARRLIGRAKAPGVAALARDTLEDDKEGKLIVFAHHREVIEWLCQDLSSYKPLVIHGGTHQKERDRAIDAFQNTLTRRLIILGIEAAAESITLHAAHNVIIAEPSPVPAKNHQAIARAHRKGQRHPVLARFVLLPGTLDETLMRIIARKTRDIARIVDPDLVPKKQTSTFPAEI